MLRDSWRPCSLKLNTVGISFLSNLHERCVSALHTCVFPFQERFQVKNPPHTYIQKLQSFLDPNVTRKVKYKAEGSCLAAFVVLWVWAQTFCLGVKYFDIDFLSNGVEYLGFEA